MISGWWLLPLIVLVPCGVSASVVIVLCVASRIEDRRRRRR